MVAVAEPSLAARLEARRLGIAMAAIMPIIATTMRSSINEKPSWRLVVILVSCSLREVGFAKFSRQRLSSLDVRPRRARSVRASKSTLVPLSSGQNVLEKCLFLADETRRNQTNQGF